MEYLQPKYKNRSIPIYSSIQKNRKVLAISHFHNGIEIIRINSGEVECFLGKEKYICAKGDIVFVPPNSIHSVLSLSENAEIQGVVFDISAVTGQNPSVPIDVILNKDRVKKTVYRNNTELNSIINQIFCEIVDKYSVTDFAYELEMRALLCKLTAVLVKEYYIALDEIKEFNRLKPVIQYIKENYKEPIRISELSSLLNVCDDHLIRLFNEAVRITPARYINNVRLEKAQKLLIDTDMSITEISYSVGFSGVNYMSKVFKEVFGLTPIRYRKNNRIESKGEENAYSV